MGSLTEDGLPTTLAQHVVSLGEVVKNDNNLSTDSATLIFIYYMNVKLKIIEYLIPEFNKKGALFKSKLDLRKK
jgi:hypothetical protein